ncbi:MAG: cell division protein [Chitinophagaceae bacterium]|nr:cell division protein [Chitinophagaceae bacterium]
MTKIHVTTFIAAPVERVFDLSRHVALYKQMFHGNRERITSGAASNLIGKGETVSVNATHAGKSRMVMLKITSFDRPTVFVEEQVKGDLESFRHEHHFKRADNGTIVIDILEFGNPKDIAGRIFGRFYFKKYLEGLLRKRTELVRSYAESEKWRAVLT